MLLSSILLLFFITATTTTTASNPEGLAFLEEKKKDPDVVTLPSGLLYKVLKAGDGGFHPGPSTPCSCHYAGTLIDGTEFDSSYGRGSPTTFAPNQVIKGWTEAMQLMVEGDKWELYIPSELAYGASGSPPKIPPDSVLVFQMEILEILKGEKVPKLKCSVADPTKDCNEKEVDFIKKASTWTEAKLSAQVERLQRLLEAHKSKPNMSEAQEQWSRRRLHIMQQLVKKGSSGGSGGGDSKPEEEL